MYTFRIQGQIYHFIEELLPSNEQNSYLQLYFYDTEHELEYRMYNSKKMNPLILQKVMDI